MRALLRCDATASGGVGHLVRCLAVGEAAHRRGWDVTLAGSIEVPFARRLVERAGIDVVPADEDDAASLARLARERRAHVLHVDHYGVTADLRPAVRRAGVMLSSTEDGLFGRRPADVVVDSTPGAEDLGREPDGSAEVLLGIRYAPLRDAVLAAREAARHRRPPGPAGRGAPAVLVVLGGTDATGATAAVVRLCATSAVPPGRLTVVAPPDCHAAVRAAWGRPDLELLGPQDDLPRLAADYDVVATAAGTTVWEMACIGVPTALVAVTENQHLGYTRAVAAGIAVGLGTGSEVEAGAPAARRALDQLLTDPRLRGRLAGAGRAMVDGLGADRLVAAWERQILTARAATPADADLLLAWRNDPTTRAASRSTEEVEPAAHRAWLDTALADPDRLLRVVEQAGTPVGTVRFDRLGPELWEVSITLAPQARGRGLAGRVLAAGENAWRDTVGDGATLLAHVRPENAASVRLFQAAGYRAAPEHDEDAAIGLLKRTER